MVDVFYKGKFTSVPASWDELTARQLREAVLIITGPYLPEVQRIRLLKVLMRWSWWRMAITMGILQFWEIPSPTVSLKKLMLFGRAVDRTARLADAAESITRFLFEGNSITRNHFPRYKKMYGPGDKLANVRMGEFCFAENYFLMWKATGETSHLNLLLACLWRPGRKTKQRVASGDLRYDFNPVVLAAQSKKIDLWPLDVKLSMAMIYDGMRKQKIEANTKVFSGEGSDGESVYGLWSIMRSVAKAGHFGDFDKVQTQYLDTILMELTEAIVEGEKMEAQLEETKTDAL